MEVEIRKSYYDTEETNIWTISYYQKDTYLYHREDGPAYQTFNLNGHLTFEEYYVNGVRHREDGPTWIFYGPYGEIFQQEFWLNGKKISESEWKMKQRLKGTLLEGKY